MRTPAWLTASSLDWYAVGLEDGARGRAVERLGDHRRACAEHNVTPNAQRYLAGRNEGLKSFCTYERGFAEGRAAHAYVANCPAGSTFPAGYSRGRELNALERRLVEVNQEISRIKTALKEGIPNARTRSIEIERLEAMTREAEQLESRIEQYR